VASRARDSLRPGSGVCQNGVPQSKSGVDELSGETSRASSTRTKATGFRADRTAVLVPGMHRSGTSALTRVLNLLGCDMSDVLLAPNEFNESGYWEDPYVLDLNERMLASAGVAWNSWESLGQDWYTSGKSAQYMTEAIELVESRFARSTLFVIKDPRIARLLPFWRTVLEESKINTKVILPLRKPAEVAASLEHRDHMNGHLAQLVWLRYNLEAEYHSRGLDRVFVTYDQLLDDWRSMVDRIPARLTGFSWPRRSAKVVSEIDAFLSGDLRHHEQKRKHAVDESVWVREVWGVLQRFAEDAVRPGDDEKLDRVRGLLNEAEGSFARVILEFQTHGEGLVARLQAADQALQDLARSTESRHDALDEQGAELREQVRQAGEVNVASQSSIDELGRRVDELTVQLATSASELDDARTAEAQLHARESALLEEAESLRAAAGLVEQLQAQRAETEREKASLEARLSEALAELDEAAILKRELTELHKAHDATELDRQTRAVESQQLHLENSVLRRQLETLRAELVIIGTDALSDESRLKSLADVVADQELQIERLKSWLAASQVNTSHYKDRVSDLSSIGQ
jgi:hypothetical protein